MLQVIILNEEMKVVTHGWIHDMISNENIRIC